MGVVEMVVVKKIAIGYRVDMTESKVLEEIKETFNHNGGEFTLEFAREVPEFVYLRLTLRDGYEFREWFYTDGSVVWIARKASFENYDVYKCYLANATYVVFCYTCENENGSIVEFRIGVYGDCPFFDAIRALKKFARR
jgi:hypothetical protein